MRTTLTPATAPITPLCRLRASLGALTLALSGMITGCASVRPAKPVLAADFASGETVVHRVAVLPVDLTVQAQGEAPRPPTLDRELLQRGLRALIAGLEQRGYPVGAIVSPDGGAHTADGRDLGAVIHATDLLALRVRLHEVTRGYHTAALRVEERQQPQRAGKVRLIEAGIDPALARSLAQLTGTDASLYTRAWAYVVPGESGGATAARVLLAVLAIVLVVTVLVAIFAGSKQGRHSRAKRSSGRRGGGRSLHRAHRGHHRVAARAVGRVFVALGRAATHAAGPPCHSCPPPPPPPPPPDEPGAWHDPPAAAPGRAPAVPRPAPRAPALRMLREAPQQSTVGMALSLVHHDTGRVLWHVEQRVPLRLDGAGDVERLVEHFLRTLPRSRAR